MRTATPKPSETIEAGIQFLASFCDGAREKDFVGFDLHDAYLGHYLAKTPYQHWTDEQKWSAYRMLRKYRKQLKQLAKIEFNHVPSPSGDREDNGKIYVSNGDFHIKLRVPKTPIVRAIQALPSQKYQGPDQGWAVPTDADSAKRLAEIASEYRLRIVPAAQSIINFAKESDQSEAVIREADPLYVETKTAPAPPKTVLLSDAIRVARQDPIFPELPVKKVYDMFPALMRETNDPITNEYRRVDHIIRALSNLERWTKEQIADWLQRKGL